MSQGFTRITGVPHFQTKVTSPKAGVIRGVKPAGAVKFGEPPILPIDQPAIAQPKDTKVKQAVARVWPLKRTQVKSTALKAGEDL